MITFTLAGILINGILNPAFVYRDARATYPANGAAEISETFALECGAKLLQQAGATDGYLPYPDEEAVPGDRYLYRYGLASATIVYLNPDGGRYTMHIDLVEDQAHCELWRPK